MAPGSDFGSGVISSAGTLHEIGISYFKLAICSWNFLQISWERTWKYGDTLQLRQGYVLRSTVTLSLSLTLMELAILFLIPGIELVITISKTVFHELPNLCSFVNEGREYTLSFERLQSAHLHNKTVVILRLISPCKSGLQSSQKVFCSRANHYPSKTKISSKVSPGKGRGEDSMHLTQFFSFLC